MAGENNSDQATTYPPGVDHVLYASADLQRGMDEIEALLGVRPVPGGRHPQYGTHNALLSIGPGTYLEVIARDPELPPPERGTLIDIPATGDSCLIGWVFRTNDIQASTAAANDAGVGLGPAVAGRRTKPDGSEIRWQLSDPYEMPMSGAVPLLIDWGTSVHPSTVAPSGGRLVELGIEHPEADSVRRALTALEADVPVTIGDEFRICAKIESKKGLVTIY